MKRPTSRSTDVYCAKWMQHIVDRERSAIWALLNETWEAGQCGSTEHESMLVHLSKVAKEASYQSQAAVAYLCFLGKDMTAILPYAHRREVES